MNSHNVPYNDRAGWLYAGAMVAEAAYNQEIGDDEKRKLNRYRWLDYCEMLWSRGIQVRVVQDYVPYLNQLKALGDLADAACVECVRNKRPKILEPLEPLTPISIVGFGGRLKSAGAMVGDAKTSIAKRLRALKDGRVE